MALAEKYGHIDDVFRMEVVTSSSTEELLELVHSVERKRSQLREWLESIDRPGSDEEIALAMLDVACAEAEARLKELG